MLTMLYWESSKKYLLQGELPPKRANFKIKPGLTLVGLQPYFGDKLPCVKVLVRWAKGKRLTNRLPNLSFTTLTWYCTFFF